MADDSENSGGWGWIAGILAVVTGALGFIGYQAGMFHKLMGWESPKERAENENKVKQIGLAFYNYSSTHEDHFPANSYDKNGKPLLSWRVHLLPYLERNDLYEKFHLDEPWDSPNNIELLKEMPNVYALAGSKLEDGKTTAQGIESKKGTKAGETRSMFQEGDKYGARNYEFTDGLRNTAMIVEAVDPVEWTKPKDIQFESRSLKDKIGFRPGHRPVMGFADGSVQALSEAIRDETLRAIATMNGGEVISTDAIRNPSVLREPARSDRSL